MNCKKNIGMLNGSFTSVLQDWKVDPNKVSLSKTIRLAIMSSKKIILLSFQVKIVLLSFQSCHFSISIAVVSGIGVKGIKRKQFFEILWPMK
jgi:hypothetical protein